MVFVIGISGLLAALARLLWQPTPVVLAISPAPAIKLFAPPAQHAIEMRELRKQVRHNRALVEDGWR